MTPALLIDLGIAITVLAVLGLATIGFALWCQRRREKRKGRLACLKDPVVIRNILAR